jgi:hypothetical protein
MTERPDRYEDAIATFDAANLAWGHFRHETLPGYPVANTDAVQAIRDALGDAAIAIVDLRAGQAPAEFAAALATTLGLLDSYRLALPAEVPRDDLDAVSELLGEARAALDDAGAY